MRRLSIAQIIARSSLGKVADLPFVPMQAGTQGNDKLDSRLRGNERNKMRYRIFADGS